MWKSILAVASALFIAAGAWATESENLGISILPAPAKVVVDGKVGDWDLSGGRFVCSDPETLREKLACWFHLMYDADNLYVLARWIDETPMNNPGSTKGDYGFAGDCLQFRTIMPNDRCAHWTAWCDREGIDVIDIAYGRGFNEGSVKDATKQGVKQAFLKNADGKGYSQELAIPWKLLTKDATTASAGQRMQITVEPNFTVGSAGRLTMKGIFKPGVTIDRVFTFMGSGCWGYGTFEAQANIKPLPFRLSDAREFPVHMENGLPVIDWTGLIQSKELEGFKAISYTMPADGYISLHIKNDQGQVVRQLLNQSFQTRGEHEVKWDGLTTPHYSTPGMPVEPANYTWEAICHTGIGLRLRGFACNAGSAPWDNGPKTNWGGDHGVPTACATDGKKVYLGWSGAEAGKAMVAVDFQGNVQWRHTRGGMGGAELVAVDGNNIYAVSHGTSIFRITASDASYQLWDGSDSTDLTIKSIWNGVTGADGKPFAGPDRANALEADAGKVYVGFTGANVIAVLDGNSGKLLKKIDLPAPGDIEAAADGKIFAISKGEQVVMVDSQTGAIQSKVAGLRNASGLALDKAGNIYVGVREPDNHVKVFTADGRPVRTIGRKGGRAATGPWQADGMLSISGMVVDPEGKLWVAEALQTPKRVSVWNTETGELVKDFFGPTHYGASGGAINPLDPDVMAGEGCEWRIDPKSGRATCTGVVERRIAGFSKFAAANGRLYLLTGQGMHSESLYNIFERVAEGDYKLRGRITNDGFWADINSDGQQQDNEVQKPGPFGMTGYIGVSMGANADLTLYGMLNKQFVQIEVKEFAPNGAPIYDVANAKPVPGSIGANASPDNRLILAAGATNFECYSTDTGNLLWTYPNTFSGVHGSHAAPPPQVGLIRGAFGTVGAAQLPQPIGAVWAINSNVGEWHLLTGSGFYLTRLFQGDPLKVEWPESATPGAIMDNTPPGLGGEDFGGSMTQGADGKLYVQAGKVGLWNLEVVGLDTVQGIAGTTITITEGEVGQAKAFREKYLQENIGTRRVDVVQKRVELTGNLLNDFNDASQISFKKQDDAAVTSAIAYDGEFLYLGWDVRDSTPWVNSANAAEFMYAHGDTVDFQLGVDPNADAGRGKPVEGDLRLSIGSVQGKPTAVIYKFVSKNKQPKVFSSGVVPRYQVDYVGVIDAAVIKINKRGRDYTVEAAIPLAELGLQPKPGLKLRGDFGVTHSDNGGTDTALRTYWNNQKTGIVNDEVFELMIEPSNWGELIFK